MARRRSELQNALQLSLGFVSLLAASDMGPRYSFEHYGAEAGLGNSTILSLLQDKTGYLWVGTESGLYRFDGSRFHLLGADDGLACLAEIRGLAEARDGSLWAVACNHLYRSLRGRFELVSRRDIVMDSLQGITADGEDGVLVGVADGILHASRSRNKKEGLLVEMLPLPMPVRGKLVRSQSAQS